MRFRSFRCRPLSFAGISFCSAVLLGCANFSNDGGFGPVAATARSQLGKDLSWQRTVDERTKSDTQIAALIAHPLSVDDAVQIALLGNHGLQGAFQELGISEADVVQSGRLPNPRFTVRHASARGVYDIEETLTFNVLSLMTAPYVHAIEKRHFVEVQSAAIIQVVQLADRTRTAYFTALAARDSLHYAWQVKNAAETSAELAQRMLGAGNWTKLDRAQQQSFYAQALQDLAHAQLADDTARAELSRLLGISDDGSVHLAERLPDLPQNIVELPSLEQTALEQRIDLQLKRAELDELARRLKLTKATRLVDVLEVGPTRVREGTTEAPFEKGYEVSLQIPIFDTGHARARKAEAIYRQAAERFAQAAIDVRADVRKASAQYRVNFELAERQKQEILPMRKLITKQDVLRYNASLISVFELLADARAQIVSVNDYILSVRDFWIAQSHLDTALLANSAP